VFSKHPGRRINVPPTEGGLDLGRVRIDAKSRVMTVAHRDLTGAMLNEVSPLPAP
jgi:hypothetical protein